MVTFQLNLSFLSISSFNFCNQVSLYKQKNLLNYFRKNFHLQYSEKFHSVFFWVRKKIENNLYTNERLKRSIMGKKAISILNIQVGVQVLNFEQIFNNVWQKRVPALNKALKKKHFREEFMYLLKSCLYKKIRII